MKIVINALCQRFMIADCVQWQRQRQRQQDVANVESLMQHYRMPSRSLSLSLSLSNEIKQINLRGGLEAE